MRHFRLPRRTRRPIVAIGVIAASVAWSTSADAISCTAEVIGDEYVHDLACAVYGTGQGTCLYDEESGYVYEVILHCTEIAVVTVNVS